ncbi:sensor histidine kinase [Helicovermis profundi]|uniref:histidine kinase n=1 Tax=Helicovermis profundi TaxID=3065157 RepID=A0AAU9EKA0_9FIRM|nr:hypothetical protein HLPR_23490 [Clostridia bacterium S502]
MKIQNKRRILIVATAFVFILGMFLYSANIEYKRSIAEQKRLLQNQMLTLSAKVNQAVNQSIRNARGLIAYVKMNPDINQNEFNEFSKNLLPKSDKIISHLTLVKGTTIKFVYPLKGNENAIGIDLAKVDSQSEDILKIKNQKISMLVGPVDLVQGGKGLINRMPIVLSDGTYWGQLSLVIKYNEMLNISGISEFSKKNNIKIEQIQNNENLESVIYSNVSSFKETPIETKVNVETGMWKISAEFKDGYNGKTTIFYFLIILGLIFSIIISYSINNILISNIKLKKLVDERTKDINIVNANLEKSLSELKLTQKELIIREKLAALGELVAGVAHEMNTPLGICITLNSYMEDISSKINKNFCEKNLKKSELSDYIRDIVDSTEIMQTNLEKTSKLVVGFKRLSTDQNTEEKRVINIKDYINKIINALSPIVEKNGCKVDIDIENNLVFETYPGIISQIITNLITNSISHGFDNKVNGKIFIKIRRLNKNIIIDFYDNGKGIDSQYKDKIFNPFFTTRRNEGNIGLGMHIVFNLVNQKLKGTIKLVDNEGKGVHFEIIFPDKIVDK